MRYTHPLKSSRSTCRIPPPIAHDVEGWNNTRDVRDPRAHRERRDGRGLSSAGRQARTRRRDQSAPRGLLTGRSAASAVRTRSTTTGAKWAISKEGGRQPIWSSNRRELFFRNGEQMLAVEVDTRAEFRSGEPTILFEEAFQPGVNNGRNCDAAPDGARFVVIEAAQQASGFELHVVLNWADELAGPPRV